MPGLLVLNNVLCSDFLVPNQGCHERDRTGLSIIAQSMRDMHRRQGAQRC